MRLQSSARVTSASMANDSPPSSSIICFVSSADSLRKSTNATDAPSRANRIAVALPLPMVSPGVHPAPTIIATLSFKRPLIVPLLENVILLGKHPRCDTSHYRTGDLAKVSALLDCPSLSSACGGQGNRRASILPACGKRKRTRAPCLFSSFAPRTPRGTVARRA